MRLWCTLTAVAIACALPQAVTDPQPRGRLVRAGEHLLHLQCAGNGTPVVVIETGFEDFSFDWVLVQDRVAPTTRVCAYDRAGYAWSQPGPKPRTFDQLNLELREALASADEHGPYVLVGHSYGGGPARHFALHHRADTAGLVLVEAVGDTQYVEMGPTAEQLGRFAKGRAVPPPRDRMLPEDRRSAVPRAAAAPEPLDPVYMALPEPLRALQSWASARPELEDAENSQREWAPEYIARWAARSQDNVLGDLPLLVLARRQGGYSKGLNLTPEQLEAARLDAQQRLARWSRRGRLQLVASGHSMHLEAPQTVADAIVEIVRQVRGNGS
jgi:pimeloyl-ACP methyl ester carboxylesterase